MNHLGHTVLKFESFMYSLGFCLPESAEGPHSELYMWKQITRSLE
jgi:hypothetical protein